MNSENRHKYALIVGISNYQDNNIPNLGCTGNDAQAIFDLLTDPDRAGFEKDNVRILLNEEATLNKIKDSISNWLYKNTDEDSIVVIFFAGHGGVEEDRFGIEKDNLAKYLLPYDTQFDNFSASALSNSDFNLFLRAIKSKRLVVFVDSCYSGGVSKKARDVKIIDNPYEKMAEGEGRLVIAASQPNQRSFEDTDLGHGVFTHHLIEALSGAADLDNDGYVSAMEVYNYLADNVPKTAKKLAGGVQEPLFTGDFKKDFVLAANRKKIEEIENEKIREKNRKKLFDWYHSGELSPLQYELTCKLIKADYVELDVKDRKVLRLLDDLLSGRISVSTFSHDFEIIKGIEELKITTSKDSRAEKEENAKDITVSAPFHNTVKQLTDTDKLKWGSMITSLAIVFVMWAMSSTEGLYWIYEGLYWDSQILLLNTIWAIFAFPSIIYFMYKERQRSLRISIKIKFTAIWISIVYLLWIVDSIIASDVYYLYLGFILNIPAFAIDCIYLYTTNKME